MQTSIWGILCVALVIDIYKLKYSSNPSVIGKKEPVTTIPDPPYQNENLDSSMKIKSGNEELKVSYDKGSKSKRGKKAMQILIQYCSS